MIETYGLCFNLTKYYRQRHTARNPLRTPLSFPLKHIPPSLSLSEAALEGSFCDYL